MRFSLLCLSAFFNSLTGNRALKRAFLCSCIASAPLHPMKVFTYCYCVLLFENEISRARSFASLLKCQLLFYGRWCISVDLNLPITAQHDRSPRSITASESVSARADRLCLHMICLKPLSNPQWILKL